MSPLLFDNGLTYCIATRIVALTSSMKKFLWLKYGAVTFEIVWLICMSGDFGFVCLS